MGDVIPGSFSTEFNTHVGNVAGHDASFDFKYAIFYDFRVSQFNALIFDSLALELL